MEGVREALEARGLEEVVLEGGLAGAGGGKR